MLLFSGNTARCLIAVIATGGAFDMGLFSRSVNQSEAWKAYIDEMDESSEEYQYLKPAIVEFMMPDNIDIVKFVGNGALLTDPSMVRARPSKAIMFFQKRMNRPFMYPLWFFSAYPDVAFWFTDLCNQYEASPEIPIKRVFGGFKEDEFQEYFIDSSTGNMKRNHLRTLVNYYMRNIKSKLECAG